MPDEIRLNIGAGSRPIDGYVSVDRNGGGEAFPLAYDDNSVDDIYASHILEHFSHREAPTVLKHWTQKLKPGGRIRIAVPDFKWVAEQYMAGRPINAQGYVMGGHKDDNDRHGCIFDSESLCELMALSGLERITRWESQTQDCSSLDVSLNLQGFKPISDDRIDKDVVACLSAPRFGPILFSRMIYDSLFQARVPFMVGQGAYWHSVLEQCLDDLYPRAEFVLTLDYDTIFTKTDVINLYRLMKRMPEYDAIAGVQLKRGGKSPLFVMRDSNGVMRKDVQAEEFSRLVTPVYTAHFGFTLFRASSLAKWPKPWFVEKPGPTGKHYEEGRIPSDISFWHLFADAGFKVGLANIVSVGHLEEIIMWPGHDMSPVYQHTGDFENGGPPPNLWMNANENPISPTVEEVPAPASH